MAITPQDIEHIAELSRIQLSEEEKERFSLQLSSILDYVAQLKEVDVSHVEYDFQVEGLKGVTREDECIPSDETTRGEILKDMPERDGDLLKVKGVFDA